jgi:ribosomal protein S18 acetylase RimI-like enzyme
MTAAGVSIRPAAPADASAILDCLHRAFEPYRRDYTPDAWRDTVLTQDLLLIRLRSMSVFVAVTPDDLIVGTIASHLTTPTEGHLRGMAVLPEWQGQAVADLLLTTAERHLRDHHCSRLTLDTTEPLHRATRFYERHGFRPSGRVTDFFGMPLHEFAKVLSAPPA